MDVVPDHYSDGIPVFKPTMSEFEDFYKYNKAINQYGMQSGIVKVIPPAEWIEQLESQSYDSASLKNVKIKSPIVQHINGSASGVYKQQNIERQRTYNLFQWHSQSEKSNYQPPAPKGQTRGASKDASKAESTDSPTISEEEKLYKVDASEFTSERCEQLERVYWKSLTYSEPMYGADMLGSLFPDSIKSWNVAHLPNVLDMMDRRLPGVNDAYLYAGLWKATFAWHLEDQDLYSINYIHFGAPKQWYSIPQEEAPRFFELMKDTFHEEYRACPEFLRHKTFLVSPNFIKKHNIRYNKIVHNQKEFIITYPYGYHAGFNYGYNVAESVNFALDDWFPIGFKTKKCECISDAVAINVEQIYCNYKGIPYKPELEAEERSDKNIEELPQSTQDSKEAKKSLKILQGKEINTKIEKKKKKAEKISSPKIEHECVLCPNDLPNKLLETKYFELLEIESPDVVGDAKYAHRICAQVFPNELKIENNKVYGIENISKEQRLLKCFVCDQRTNSKKPGNNACFQCSAPKCVRSFHATCGLGDGVTYCFDKEHIKFQCKYHRRKKHLPDDMEKLKTISPGSMIQFILLDKKQIHCGSVVSNNEQEKSFEVMLYPKLNERIEVSYESVQLSDTMEAVCDESARPPIQGLVSTVSKVEKEPPLKKHKSTTNYAFKIFNPNAKKNPSNIQNPESAQQQQQQQVSAFNQVSGPVMGTFRNHSDLQSSYMYPPMLPNHVANGILPNGNAFIYPPQPFTAHSNQGASYAFVPQIPPNYAHHPTQMVDYGTFNQNNYQQTVQHNPRFNG